MVRAGIILYGLKPSDECPVPIDLRPVMRLKARLAMVKQVPPGVGVSYGSIYHTQKESSLATIPIGYADGYTRMLSRKAQVLLRGQRAPVVGRICMDQCMVDVSHVRRPPWATRCFFSAGLICPQMKLPPIWVLSTMKLSAWWANVCQGYTWSNAFPPFVDAACNILPEENAAACRGHELTVICR